MFRPRTALFAALSALSLLAPAAQAQNIKTLETPFERMGWEGVGRLDLGNGFCTGTLIAKDIVLTAAHCVYDHVRSGKDLKRSVVFRAGYQNGVASAERRVVAALMPEAFARNTKGKATNETIPHDVALLQLESEIFVTSASPFRIHAASNKGTDVTLVSYGRGREEALTYETGCAVTGRYSDGILQFDCAATFGSSGAPVFVEENGTKRILSIISGGHTEDDGSYVVYGMELSAPVNKLMAQLRAQQSLPPTSEGALRLGAGAGSSGLSALRQRTTTPGAADSGFKRVRVTPGS